MNTFSIQNTGFCLEWVTQQLTKINKRWGGGLNEYLGMGKNVEKNKKGDFYLALEITTLGSE